MKKSLLALAVLASAAGAAQAASSVTLYGRVDVGYEKFSNTLQDLSGNDGNTGDGYGNSGFNQTGNNDTRLGIKGQEDLGNGLAATFQLEGRLNADTGSYDSGRGMFDRESTVGLKGNFGHIRFGRSKSAMERALGNFAPGERVAAVWDPYTSLTRHSNAAFYDYSMGGFTAGGDITTKGGSNGNSVEGVKGSKVGFGIHAGYNGTINDKMGYSVAAAYQKDGGASSNSREWGVGAQFNINPVGIGGTYADYKEKVATDSYKLRTWSAYVTADITANDAVYAKYISKRAKFAGETVTKQDMFGLGYSHALSKRTSIYADVARYRNRADNGAKVTAYDVALRHAF